MYNRVRMGGQSSPWIIVRDFAPRVNLLVDFCNNNNLNNLSLSQEDGQENNNSEGSNRSIQFVLSVPKHRTMRDIKKMIMKEPKVLETLSPKQCEIILYQLNEVSWSKFQI